MPYSTIRPRWINWLAPGRCGSNFKSVIFKHILRITFIKASCEIAPRWIPQNTFDDKSTLVQVMAWCRQAPSHYLSQCWPRSMPPYDVTRPQWVKIVDQSFQLETLWPILQHHLDRKSSNLWVNSFLSKPNDLTLSHLSRFSCWSFAALSLRTSISSSLRSFFNLSSRSLSCLMSCCNFRRSAWRSSKSFAPVTFLRLLKATCRWMSNTWFQSQTFFHIHLRLRCCLCPIGSGSYLMEHFDVTCLKTQKLYINICRNVREFVSFQDIWNFKGTTSWNLGPTKSQQSKSLSCQQMPWVHVSPGHQ